MEESTRNFIHEYFIAQLEIIMRSPLEIHVYMYIYIYFFLSKYIERGVCESYFLCSSYPNVCLLTAMI